MQTDTVANCNWYSISQCDGKCIAETVHFGRFVCCFPFCLSTQSSSSDIHSYISFSSSSAFLNYCMQLFIFILQNLSWFYICFLGYCLWSVTLGLSNKLAASYRPLQTATILRQTKRYSCYGNGLRWVVTPSLFTWYS